MFLPKEALKNPKAYDIWGFDTENDPVTGEFKLGWIVDPRGKGVYFTDRWEMAAFLQQSHPTTPGNKIRPIMCALNVSYDLGVLGIDAFLWEQRMWDGRFITCNPIPIELLPKRKLHIVRNDLVKKEGKIKEGRPSKINQSKRKTRFLRGKFIFVDLANFFQGIGLKGLADKFNVEYIDVHEYKDARIIEACYSHANSGHEVLTKVQTLLLDKFSCELKITAATTFVTVFQRNFMREEDTIVNPLFDKSRGHGILNLYQHKLWKKINGYEDTNKHTYLSQLYDPTNKNWTGFCYKGGWTDVALKGERKVCAIDITSSYGNQMRHHPMPDLTLEGFVEEINLEGCSNKDFLLRLDKFEGAALVVMQTPKECYIPFLLSSVHYETNRNKNLVGLTGKIEGYYTFPELRYALSLGYKLLKVKEYYVCKQKIGMFDDYIDTMFELKLQPQTKELGKLGGNSLSGKWGQRRSDNSAIIKMLLVDDTIDPSELFSFGEVSFYYERPTEEPEDFNSHAYPLIIAYITAYARIQLHKTIVNVGEKRVCMWDTDSIIFTYTTETDLNDVLSRIDVGKHLGGWDVKWRGLFEARGSKFYRYKPDGKSEWYYHIKGVPEENRKDYWYNGFAGKMRPVKYREYMRRLQRLGMGKSLGDYQLGKWLFLNKIDTQPPAKRSFDWYGNSTPYNVEEVELLLSAHQKLISEAIKGVRKRELKK